MSASSIGPFPFVRLSEFPLPPQEQIELESRAGRHGVAAWLTGFKGQPFASIRDDMVNAGGEWVDEEVVVDGHLISSRVPDDLPAFCRAIIKALS